MLKISGITAHKNTKSKFIEGDASLRLVAFHGLPRDLSEKPQQGNTGKCLAKLLVSGKALQ